MNKIKIFAFGGLNENGKNMYAIDVNNDLFIFDAGLKYADDKMLGVDYIIPDFKFLQDNIKRIKGIFLTHAHEKYMGAVCDIVRNIPDINVYATKFTCDYLKKEFEDEGIEFKNLHLITAHKKINFGKNSVFPVSLTHSVPDTVGYVLNTDDGAIVYTGNFVFDSSMTGAYQTDIGKLAYIGKQGVLCLLSESEYADRVGYTTPNNRIANDVRDVLLHNDGRIIVTLLTNHISRLQELFTEISKTHRKIVVMGKKMQRMVNYVIDEGYVTFDKEQIGNLTNIEDRDSVILVSNENQKPFVNLERIVNGYDKYVKLLETDTVFYLEPIGVGMEKKAAKLADDISKIGANVVTLSSKDHLLNHASQEDLMLMLNLMQPKYYFPVIGEYRHMLDNANIASSIGIQKENIILKLNGEAAIFENGKLTEEKEIIPINELLIDGNSTKDIGELVLKDRELLSDNGIVIICATLDKKTKAVVAGPEVLTRGFIYVKESTEIIENMKKISLEVINSNISNNYVEFNKIKNGIREELGKYLFNETECKPMIITVITEI
ncbi:MAG: ribonuclease J [Bacilli bacterium]|nr:ribonuclease J [Bacilli bacterium]MBO6194813.1 ribonuclease J [Bacilli bacterium]